MNCIKHNIEVFSCKDKECRKKLDKSLKEHFEFQKERGMIWCSDSGGYWYSDYRTKSYDAFQ